MRGKHAIRGRARRAIVDRGFRNANRSRRTIGGIAAALLARMPDTFETIPAELLTDACGGFGPQLTTAMHRARDLGLHITSTTGGRHAPSSYHYQGRALDAAGS